MKRKLSIGAWAAVFVALTVLPGIALAAGGVLSLDGVNDFLRIPGSTGLPAGNSAFTIEAWVNPDTLSGNRHISQWGNFNVMNQSNGYRFEGDGFRHFFWGVDHTAGPTGLAGDIASTHPAGWHHVAVTGRINGGNFDRRFFVDGVQIGTTGTTAQPNVILQNFLLLGARANNATGTAGTEFFDGLLDEVRIWNTDLSDVGGTNYLTSTNLRNQSFSQDPTSLAYFYPQLAGNLAAYYSFDDWDGRNPQQDVFGNLPVGTLENGALLDLLANAPVTFLQTPVPLAPEPGSVLLFAAGLGGIAVWSYRRRRSG